jgi:hypothetical protein
MVDLSERMKGFLHPVGMLSVQLVDLSDLVDSDGDVGVCCHWSLVIGYWSLVIGQWFVLPATRMTNVT